MTVVGIVGLGLVGGSIGLGLARRAPDVEIIGFDRDEASAAAALERSAVTHLAADVGSVARTAEVTVVATPVSDIPAVCELLAPHARVVTDVGSTKVTVVAAAEKVLGGRFVGGHPMAGSERHGIAGADGDLFEGAPWALTPTSESDPEAVERVVGIVSSLGAVPVTVGVQAHDELVARISHLPQIAASALMDVAANAGEPGAAAALVGPGFRDCTRIAGSDPDLWVSILKTNRDAVAAALSEMSGRLATVGAFVEGERWDDLRAWLASARTLRAEMFTKRGWTPHPPVRLTLSVPDRPGVLAEVTAAAARLDANIEDLEIVHSTEGGRGRLQLVVAENACGPLSAALDALGYSVEQGRDSVEN